LKSGDQDFTVPDNSFNPYQDVFTADMDFSQVEPQAYLEAVS
jgi:hypothetical protein